MKKEDVNEREIKVNKIAIRKGSVACVSVYRCGQEDRSSPIRGTSVC